jgi:hypothetical protein
MVAFVQVASSSVLENTYFVILFIRFHPIGVVARGHWPGRREHLVRVPAHQHRVAQAQLLKSSRDRLFVEVLVPP